MDRNRPALMNHLRRGLWLVPLVFLALFFIYPLITILGVSLLPEGILDLSGFGSLITSAYYRATLGFTIGQATLSTVLTLALALPSAYVFTRFQFPGKTLLMSLSMLPFVLPTVVVAAAFTALIGPRGVVNTGLMTLLNLDRPPVQLENTLAIILFAHIFYNYALALRMISGFWANQNTRIEESARILGCHGWRLWWEIRLPILRPAILAAAVLVFIFTFTSFGVVLILGGPRFATLEVEIYRQAVNIFNLPVAAALSLVQIGVMFLMMAIYTRLQGQITTGLQSAQQVARRPRNRLERMLISVNLLLIVVLLFTPLLALVVRSFTVGGEGFTVQHYRLLSENPRQSILFVSPVEAISNSVIFALATMLMAVLLGMIAAYRIARHPSRAARWIDPLFMLPLATSAVTLGFGFIIALDEPPLNLRTSPLLIPIAHTLVAIPFVVRSLLPVLRRIAPALPESARVLGASSWQVWRWIDLPLISRGLIVGATFAFTISMGEFGASIFVARPDTPTIPVVIFRLLGQPGVSNYGQALAMSAILMLIVAVGFLLIENVRTVGVGEF